MPDPVFSAVIPAHNEEKYIGKCLEAIEKAAAFAAQSVQVIVTANRCTDKTAEIAEKHGAEVCVNNGKCISSIRNAGARLADGDIIVTVDADSVMTEGSLAENGWRISSDR